MSIGRLFSLVLVWGLACSAQANETVIIDDAAVTIDAFPMAYWVDDANGLTIEQVQQQSFTPSTNKISLGTEARNLWTRFTLHNVSDNQKALYVHFPQAYHNRSVAFFQVKNDNVRDKTVISLDDAKDSPFIYGGKAVYPVTLQEGEVITLYVQSVSFSHQWFTLSVYDEYHSRQALVSGFADIALMVGILLALVFYNFLMYFAASRKENFYYSLYLISGGLWIALSYGLLANVFGWYGSNILPLHLSLLTMPMFLILFMTEVFETRRRYPIEHKALMVVMVLLVADFLYGLVDLPGAMRPASSLAALMMLVSMSVTVSLVLKGNVLARLFLIGHLCFVLFSGLAVLFYKGIIGFYYVSSHGVGIGIMLESLMLASILAYRMRMLERMKASQKSLKAQAETDPLTQLFNRRGFNNHVGVRLSQRSDNHTSAVLAVDIDHFKQVNDQYGHATGDKVIVALAKILEKHSRQGDICARFGGEEFVIMIASTTKETVNEMAERIRQTVASELIAVPEQPELHFTISIGVAMVDTTQPLEQALEHADQALYEAKAQGRNRVCFYDARAAQKVALDTSLS